MKVRMDPAVRFEYIVTMIEGLYCGECITFSVHSMLRERMITLYLPQMVMTRHCLAQALGHVTF
jgi:hypothetical protein